jgi:pimeloyl-ACP methyl ester carboxylesterase
VSSIYTWKDVLPALGTDHDVIAVDLPGFGGSDIPGRFELALYPRVVFGLLERLGVGRAAVVGNSLGGAVAVMMAAQRPEAVDRLVLIDAAGFNLEPRDRPWVLRAAGRPEFAQMTEAFPALLRPLLRLGLRQVFHDEALVTPERLNEYAVPLRREGASRFVHAVLTSGGRIRFEESVRAVRAPTLVLWGEQDAWIPVRDGERFARAIPGTGLVTLPSCGHLPQEEKPREVVRLLRQFLR